MNNRAEPLIEVKLVDNNVLVRWPCNVCGGETEKVDVLAEAETAEGTFRVCETCLREDRVDRMLAENAARLRKNAETIVPEMLARADYYECLIGRISVPTYAEWKAASDKRDREWVEADRGKAFESDTEWRAWKQAETQRQQSRWATQQENDEFLRCLMSD